MKAGTHSAFGEGSHTAAYTPKQGPSLPRPQRGIVPPAKFLLFHHAFIYIHFPVLCEPPLSATALSQTIFHRVFQLLPQTAYVRFHRQKQVHTRLCSKNRTQGHTRRNRGLPDEAAITTLDTYCTFTNIPGPGIRTANFAAFGSWSGVLPKNAESLGTAMRISVSLFRGVAAPLGCAALFAIWRCCCFYAWRAGLSALARSKEVSLIFPHSSVDAVRFH